jgi:ribose 5-phosphate isomerase B
MKVIIGADHGGFALKRELSEVLRLAGHDVIDIGAHCYDQADDYPDFSLAVARGVARGEGERGIILCGSGVGASVAANKIIGIRAGLCHDTYSARQGVEHDDMNVLCLGGRVVGAALAADLMLAFLNARYSGEERHARRLEKLLAADNMRS